MKREDYEDIKKRLSNFLSDANTLTVILTLIESLVEDHATPSCTHPESDIPFGNLVKDPDLMFTCLEVADSMRTTESSDEVLAFAKRIYEWVK